MKRFPECVRRVCPRCTAVHYATICHVCKTPAVPVEPVEGTPLGRVALGALAYLGKAGIAAAAGLGFGLLMLLLRGATG